MQIKHRIKWKQTFFFFLNYYYLFNLLCKQYRVTDPGQCLMTSSWHLGLMWWDTEGAEAGACHTCGLWILLPEILVARGGASTIWSGRFLWRWIDRLPVFRFVVVDTWIGGWRMQIWKVVYNGVWMRMPKSFAVYGGAWDSWWWSENLGFSNLEVRDWSVQLVCWNLEILWWQGFENECDWWDFWGANAKKDRGDSFELYGSDTIWKT